MTGTAVSTGSFTESVERRHLGFSIADHDEEEDDAFLTLVRCEAFDSVRERHV